MKNRNILMWAGLLILTLVLVSVPFILKGNNSNRLPTEGSKETLPAGIEDLFETVPIVTEPITEQLTEIPTTTLSEEEQSRDKWISYYWNINKDKLDCTEDEFKAECKELIDLGCDETYACSVIAEKYYKEAETQETSLSREDLRQQIAEIAGEKQDLDNNTDVKVIPYKEAEYDANAEMEYTEYEYPKTMYTTCFTNVRRHPSIESDVVAQLNAGDSVEILGEVTIYNGEYCLYYKLQLPEGEGYINAFQLTLMNPVEAEEIGDKTAENLGAIDISEYFKN